jgi:hypothetical protein
MASKSPFPGMDPWLEATWGDVHTALISYARDAITPQLPTGLHARMEQRVFVETLDRPLRARYPDLHIVARERPFTSGQSTPGNGGVATVPLRVRVMNDPVTQNFIQITDSSGAVVTAIDVLSPSNKVAGKGRELYLNKQREFRYGHVNLVEIDLVRAGERVTEITPENLSPEQRTPYYAIVSRTNDSEWVALYPIPLSEPLPTLAVPLREGDADITLPLQTLIDKAYEMGGYGDAIDYAEAPVPPLTARDADWAKKLLVAAGRL